MNGTLKRIGMILLVSGVVAVVANCVHPRRIPWVQDWSRQVEAKAREGGVEVIPFAIALKRHASGENAFIDARASDEFSTGHIPGAVSIPFQGMDEHFEQLAELIDSGRELVVYCSNRTCDDALLLAMELQAMGASPVVLYVDGFDFWKKHGGTVEP